MALGYADFALPTDCNGPDTDAFFKMCIGSIVCIFGLEYSLPAKRVHESRAPYIISNQYSTTHFNGFIRQYLPVPEAPQTIKQNWIPFLTFFFLRILI